LTNFCEIFFWFAFCKLRGVGLGNTWDYLCRSQCICDIAVTVIKQVHRGEVGFLGPATEFTQGGPCLRLRKPHHGTCNWVYSGRS